MSSKTPLQALQDRFDALERAHNKAVETLHRVAEGFQYLSIRSEATERVLKAKGLLDDASIGIEIEAIQAEEALRREARAAVKAPPAQAKPKPFEYGES